MAAPEPVTPPLQEFHVRVRSANDLEVTLVKFLKRIFDVYRLDNPTLNLAQQPGAFPKEYDPDGPPISYDPATRAAQLYLKVPPRIERGYVPRTVTGEIEVDKLPDCPAIIVQCVSANVANDVTIATVRIYVNVYDENPDSGGYQDALNIVEAIAMALGSFGKQAIDHAYPIVMPLEWKLVEADTFPHFIAEMTTRWEMATPRPMPDWNQDIMPVESLEIGLKWDTESYTKMRGRLFQREEGAGDNGNGNTDE